MIYCMAKFVLQTSLFAIKSWQQHFCVCDILRSLISCYHLTLNNFKPPNTTAKHSWIVIKSYPCCLTAFCPPKQHMETNWHYWEGSGISIPGEAVLGGL